MFIALCDIPKIGDYSKEIICPCITIYLSLHNYDTTQIDIYQKYVK